MRCGLRAGWHDGLERLCQETDKSSARYNRWHIWSGFAVNGLRPGRRYGRHTRVGSIRSIFRRSHSARPALGQWACRGCCRCRKLDPVGAAQRIGSCWPDVGSRQLIFGLVLDLFRSRAALEAEILVLRQQIIVLRRGRVGRLPFSATDRSVLDWICRLFPNTRDALAIVRPETVMRWHRAGFRSYWAGSPRRPGRPAVLAEIRQLIREMSIANPLWGAPRIHGELLKIGIDVGQTSVAKYMARRRGPPRRAEDVSS